MGQIEVAPFIDAAKQSAGRSRFRFVTHAMKQQQAATKQRSRHSSRPPTKRATPRAAAPSNSFASAHATRSTQHTGHSRSSDALSSEPATNSNSLRSNALRNKIERAAKRHDETLLFEFAKHLFNTASTHVTRRIAESRLNKVLYERSNANRKQEFSSANSFIAREKMVQTVLN
ncbi:hypothetical protein [Burkholderia sp. SRS-W-2-2016]|uniref:hypothetical protein n=1 Tax=Burkholderia sp. SRS-W-2-2016 TaxID=1926878 RepID=UPI00117EDF76|nr:hypothetical protein [Burkholderia sp. SRS-W-2-2016]